VKSGEHISLLVEQLKYSVECLQSELFEPFVFILFALVRERHDVVVIGGDPNRCPALDHVVLVASDVVLPLMFLPEYLDFLYDLWFVERGLDSLVIEEDDPQACDCVCFDLRVLQLLFAEEGQQTGQEVGVAEEVQLRRTRVRSVAQE